MKYIEIMQRLQLLFPTAGDGLIKSLFNQYSKIFQRETYLTTLTSLLIDKAEFVNGVYSDTDVIQLECVSENNIPFSLIYVDTADLSNGRVKVSNQKFYFIIDNSIYLCKSNDSGYLSAYTPEHDIVLSGRFINGSELINSNTNKLSDFNDELAITVLYALCSELYKSISVNIELAEYYKKEFKESVRQMRKYGMSANRPITLRSNW